MRPINKIIIHCSASPEGRADTIKEIDAWHRARGFKSIGYHYVIYLDGSLHLGRAVEKQGAHCTGQNKNSIGICYIGGLAKDGKTSKDTRTDAQKETLRSLVAELKSQYPNATVHGHNEFAPRDCPCFNIKKEPFGKI